MLRKKVSFVLLILIFLWAAGGYCSDLERLKAYFLEADYKAAITEGEKLIASSSHSDDADELYYILGLCYLKDGNYLRASDIFEIILREFKKSGYKDEAQMGLGDTFFLRGNFQKAQDCYMEVIRDKPSTELKAELYYRLSQTGFKKGDMQQGKDYLDKLKAEFALNPELKLDRDLYSVLDPVAGPHYTVQVGSFSSSVNARNLTERLIRQGYPAYVEEEKGMQEAAYKVRVGKFKSLQEAKSSQEKLTESGYPTKLCP